MGRNRTTQFSFFDCVFFLSFLVVIKLRDPFSQFINRAISFHQERFVPECFVLPNINIIFPLSNPIAHHIKNDWIPKFFLCKPDEIHTCGKSVQRQMRLEEINSSCRSPKFEDYNSRWSNKCNFYSASAVVFGIFFPKMVI